MSSLNKRQLSKLTKQASLYRIADNPSYANTVQVFPNLKSELRAAALAMSVQNALTSLAERFDLVMQPTLSADNRERMEIVADALGVSSTGFRAGVVQLLANAVDDNVNDPELTAWEVREIKADRLITAVMEAI